MSKGSKRRPGTNYEDNYLRIFQERPPTWWQRFRHWFEWGTPLDSGGHIDHNSCPFEEEQ